MTFRPTSSFLRLLSCTALVSVAGLASTSPAEAACPNATTNNEFIICTGTDNVGINKPALDLFVLLNPATISTAGDSVIMRGGILTLGTGATIQSTGGTAVRINQPTSNSATVNLNAGSSITGGILLDYAASQNVVVAGSVDNITFGDNTPGTQHLTLYSTGTISGIAQASSSVNANQIFNLTGTTNGTFDTDRIGVSILNFDTLRKSDSSTWTLTGTNAQTWDITDGTLVGTTANLGNVSNGSVLRFDQATNGTYGGVISSGGSVQIQGGGNVTFSGANTYTGGTTISGAGSALSISADNNLGGANGSVTLNNGGALSVSGNLLSSRSLNVGAGGGVISGGGTFETTGDISGSGLLTITGNSTLGLGGTSTKTGGYDVTAGSTLLGTSDSLTGNILNNGTLSFLQNGSGTYAGNISGNGNITVGGLVLSTLTLTGTNTHTGTLMVSGAGATLAASSAANLGGTGSILRLNFNGLFQYDAGFDITQDMMFTTGSGRINTQGFNASISGDLSGNALLVKSGSGTLTLTGSSTKTGGFNVSAGTLVGDTGNLTGNIANAGTLRFDQAGNGTYAGVLSGAGGVQVQGGGNITFSGANTYTGGTTIDNATLTAGANNNLGGAGNLTLTNGGTLNMSTAFGTSRNIILSGGDGVINFASGGSSLNGVVSGTGTLVKTGGGVLTLNNIGNTYSGGTVVSGGLVAFTRDAGLGNAAGDITIDNNAGIFFLGSFNSARDINLTSGIGAVTGLASSINLSGTIAGAGGLSVDGSSSVTLSGTNTYAGGTHIITNSTILAGSNANLGNAAGGIYLQGGALSLTSSFSSARDIDVTAAGGIINTSGAITNIFSGDLSGTGLLTKTGSGTLQLTGSSTKTGGFDIAGGTLVGNAGNLTGNIANAGTVNFNQASNSSYAGIISGLGSFIKGGAGNLILSNTHTYSGTTTVDAGRLAVNGSIAGSAVTVNAGGNLGGSGTIGDLALNGRLTPGNSIGTLTAGSTTFNTGSLYEVEIDDGLNSDRLDITGTLTINAGADVSVLAAPGTYADGSLYTIITHTGARTGTFASIIDNLAFLDASLVYNANDVQILLGSNGTSFSNVGKDQVQYDTGTAIENLGAGNDLYDAFIGLTVKDAQNALDTLSGEHIPGVTGAMTQTTGIIRSALNTRMQAITYNRGGAISAALAPAAGHDGGMFSEFTAAFVEPAAGNTQLRNGSSRVWMEAFGTTGQSARQGTASKQNRGSAGMLAGIDGEIDDQTYIGFFGGFEQGEVNTYSERASSAISNYHAGMYATHQLDPIRLSGGIGGTYHDIETKRYVVFPGLSESPESETNGYTASAFIEASHPFEFSNDWAIEPFAGASVTYSHMNGYEETGGGATNLAVDGVSALTPAHTIGLRFGKTITTEADNAFRMSGSLGWQHSYGDLEDKATMRFTSGTTSFTTMGPGRVRDAALVGAGIDAKIGSGLNAYGGYNGTLSPDAQDHALTAGIKLSF